jgi:O-antigen/teichoic acid export membrane protein
MLTYVKAIFGKAGVDGTIAFTILTRLIQAGSGVISIFFIAKFLTQSEQGYYYTFSSILAIQIFFELGLSGIITQYTAYEFAHLSLNDLELSGEEYYKSRLSSLLHFCIKWFAWLSVLTFFILYASGFYFFTTFHHGLNIDWKTPWLILCFSTALNLFIDPILAYFDGLGHVRDMAKVRLIQKTVNIVLLFVFFLLDFKLYAGGLASLIAILVNYGQILFSARVKVLKVIWKEKGKWVVNYLKEILPFQLRIAVSWISGYFIFQLFNPVLFATEGAVVAGQMGMTLQALNGISSISMSWITTKVPIFSKYIAKKEYFNLDNTFNKALKGLLQINFLLLLIFIGIVSFLKWSHLPYYNRFLPIVPTIILCVTCFVNQMVFSWATYLRCHKAEPFLIQSVVIAVLVALSTYFLGNRYGLYGIVSGYGFLVVFVSLIWSYILFIKKKKLWHQ